MDYTQSTDVTKLKDDLATLAAEINSEHEAATRGAIEALEHARRCGELLTNAKEKLKHGAWTPWLEENCTVSPRQTQKYMRLYSNWHVIEEAKANSDSDLTTTIENSLLLVADREITNNKREAKHCDGERITLGGTGRWGDMLNPFFHRRFEDITPGEGHWCGIGGGDAEHENEKSPA